MDLEKLVASALDEIEQRMEELRAKAREEKDEDPNAPVTTIDATIMGMPAEVSFYHTGLLALVMFLSAAGSPLRA